MQEYLKGRIILRDYSSSTDKNLVIDRSVKYFRLIETPIVRKFANSFNVCLAARRESKTRDL